MDITATPRLIFVEDAAEMLNRSPAQVRWMLKKGTGPKHAKIAGRVCFRESDVLEFIAAAFADGEATGGDA